MHTQFGILMKAAVAMSLPDWLLKKPGWFDQQTQSG